MNNSRLIVAPMGGDTHSGKKEPTMKNLTQITQSAAGNITVKKNLTVTQSLILIDTVTSTQYTLTVASGVLTLTEV